MRPAPRPMPPRRVLLRAAIAAAALACGLAPAAPRAEFGESTLVRHPAFQRQQGPRKAKGVIVWSPGSGLDFGQPDAEEAHAPEFVDWLYGQGWDFYFVQRRDSQLYRSRGEHSHAIVNAVEGLRRAGYAKVVLAAQSAGGIYSMMASARMDAPPHAIVTLASGPSDPRPGDDGVGRVGYYDLLAKARAERMVVISLAGDEIIGQRPKARIEAALALTGAAWIDIHEPGGEELEGHGGAFGGRFAARFADCIARFLDPDLAPDPHACDGR